MKILLLHNRYLHYGGEDTIFEAERDLLLAKGHQVQTLIFQNKTLDSWQEKIRTGLYSLYSPNSRRLLRNKIQDFQPDIIHVHNFWKEASPSIFYEAASQNVPTILTVHNFRLLCANALLFRNGKICELCTQSVLPIAGIRYACYDNRLLSAQVTFFSSIHKILSTWKNKVNGYIFLSDFAKKKFLNSSLHLSEQQAFVKPNFVEDKGVGEVSERKPFFLYVGRLSEEKGIRTLLEASQEGDFDIEIIGGGDLESLVKDFAEKNVKITYHGFQSKGFIVEKMKQAKALLFPSVWYEGMPLVILEAFSTGLPILISNIDNLNELVKDGYNGWHFEAANAKNMAEKMQEIQNTPNYENFCKNARKTYEQQYTPEKIYEQLIQIYQAVILAKLHST